MSKRLIRQIVVLSIVATSMTTSPVVAQWFRGYDPCACAQPIVQQCVQPVAQTCYRTVPVTEYRQVKQTVRRPVIETKYVEQPVTEYRPVTETRTVDVPTVSYQNITECRAVTRNAGYWTTQYQPNCRVSPCQYDGRANLIGWWNRTTYSLRSAFAPRYIAHRQYVPRQVVQMVPTTRQVAHHGTRKVTYNVTRMVAHTTTRKVAVNTVRYVDEQVTAMRPVTVMKTVPIGSSVAYGYSPYATYAPQTALQPEPDPASSKRSANAGDNKNSYDGDAKKFNRTRESKNAPDNNPFSGQRTSHEKELAPTPDFNGPQAQEYNGPLRHTVSRPVTKKSGWVARKKTTAGPALVQTEK